MAFSLLGGEIWRRYVSACLFAAYGYFRLCIDRIGNGSGAYDEKKSGRGVSCFWKEPAFWLWRMDQCGGSYAYRSLLLRDRRLGS